MVVAGGKLTPDARVVGFELQGGEAAGADGVDVAAGRVLPVADATVPAAGAFVKDIHVVTVEMESGRWVLVVF